MIIKDLDLIDLDHFDLNDLIYFNDYFLVINIIIFIFNLLDP